MPTKIKITNQPPVTHQNKTSPVQGKIKIFPRTTKITLQGSCLHTYDTRVPIIGNLAKKERTVEREKAFERFKNQSIKYLEQSECPDCSAERTLTSVRGEAQHLTQFFHVSPVPALEGTVKQVAFAESARLDRLKLRVSGKIMVVREMLTEVSAADALLIHALKTTWTGVNWVDNISGRPDKGKDEDPALLTSLAKEFNNRQGYSYWAQNPYVALGAWLLIRDSWFEDEYLFQEERVKAWIAMKKTNRIYSARWVNPSDVPQHVLNAVNITVRAGKTWASLNEAWEFYQTLKNTYTYEHVLGLLPQYSGTVKQDMHERTNIWGISEIQDVAEQAAVIEALSRPASPPFPPF